MWVLQSLMSMLAPSHAVHGMCTKASPAGCQAEWGLTREDTV